MDTALVSPGAQLRQQPQTLVASYDSHDSRFLAHITIQCDSSRGRGDLFPSLCHSGSHVSSSRSSIVSFLNLTACGEREGKQGNCKNIFQNQNRKSGGHGMATDAVGARSRTWVAPDCGGLGNSFHCRSGMKRERTGECTAVTD